VKGRARVVGIFPNDASITRLVGAVLLEQDENWQLEGRRMFTADSMAAIPALEALPALQDAWNKSPHSGPRGSW
jgi:putative transposase